MGLINYFVNGFFLFSASYDPRLVFSVSTRILVLIQ